MKRFSVGIPSVLAASLLVASAAVAADVAPVAKAASTPATTAAPASQGTPARTTTANAKKPVRDSEAGVHQLVCLNMSLRCFTVKPPEATKASLDLRAPDIRLVVTEAELQQRLDDPYEVEQQQEQVEVEGRRPDIYVAPGIASLPWAVMHPTQAWRILLPVPPTQAK